MKMNILPLTLLALSAQTFAAPTQIIITRHGEKPDVGNELSTQGCERAFSLLDFFLRELGDVKPAAIYAMKPNSDDGSVRPIQTIAYTADHYKLSIEDKYTRLDYSNLVNEIMTTKAYDNQTVLISWEHKAIPGLAQAFGLKSKDVPAKWPGIVFDEAWIITNLDQKKPTLTITAERVLSTDNPSGGDDWVNGPTSDAAPQVTSALANKCANNDVLNALVKTWVSPALE